MSSVQADDAIPVEHTIRFPGHPGQYLTVESLFPAGTADMELVLPNWTPGSYKIVNHAGNIEGFEARDANGTALNVTKTAKNRWRISGASAGRVRVSYDVWAGELSVGGNWVDQDFAILNPAGLILFSETSRVQPQSLAVDLPPRWNRIHTSLAREPGGDFRADNYDVLVDSPLLTGVNPAQGFSVDESDFFLALEGNTKLWRADEALQDVESIVRKTVEFWGDSPFARPYWFLNAVTRGSAGLEHDHSSLMLAGPWVMRHRGEYVQWLGLVSHEFFHAWNVRRLRPAALAEYDYESENYSSELWLAEGLSSYYDNLLLFRAGLITVPEYFDLLAREFFQFETAPGRRVRSAERASFDAWIKHYQPDANSVNSTVSYYRSGAVIGFITDVAIRRATRDRSSLDDVLRLMYQRFDLQQSGGYRRGDFEATVTEVAGDQVGDLARRLIQQTDDPDIDGALEWLGMTLDRQAGIAIAEGSATRPAGGLGIGFRKDATGLEIGSVVRDGAAARAGVFPGDELIAIDGLRVTEENIGRRILRLEPGAPVALTVARNERLITLQATADDARPENYRIIVESGLSGREKSRLESWLGRDLTFAR